MSPDASASPLPEHLKPLTEIMGDSASPSALGRLSRTITQKGRSPRLKERRKAMPLLRSALEALKNHDYEAGSALVLQSLEHDRTSGLGWHILAIAQEKMRNYGNALSAYEAALKLLPDEMHIAADLGRLAQKLGYNEIAEKLLLKALAHNPGSVEITNNLACLQRDRGDYGSAIETVRNLLTIDPTSALLWNTLGSILSDQGEMEQAVTFYDEALRLDPDFSKALYNRANARQALGDSVQALADIEEALSRVTDPLEIDTINMAKSMTQIFTGRLREGFETYEVRFSRNLDSSVHFVTTGRRWQPHDELAGAKLIVFGEQGLGDEVMFFSVVPDLLRALGPDGHLTLAIERRLAPLFQRSFPQVTIVAHHSVKFEGRVARKAIFDGPEPQFDLWAPVGSLWQRFRRNVSDFGDAKPFLIPPPDRVAHWRNVLADLGPEPKVGVVWKSLVMDGMRARYFSSFQLWERVLRVPGLTFVNLQYGDVSAELEHARDSGLTIWSPPGIDLKDDLDDIAALGVALDLIVGQPNATTNIASASGASYWGLATPDDWTCFGTRDRFPMYGGARALFAEGFGRWESVMDQLTREITEWASSKTRNVA